MARKKLIACNGCGAIREVEDGVIELVSGWFVIEFKHAPLDNEEWLACSPECPVALGDITAEALAERASVWATATPSTTSKPRSTTSPR